MSGAVLPRGLQGGSFPPPPASGTPGPWACGHSSPPPPLRSRGLSWRVSVPRLLSLTGTRHRYGATEHPTSVRRVVTSGKAPLPRGPHSRLPGGRGLRLCPSVHSQGSLPGGGAQLPPQDEGTRFHAHLWSPAGHTWPERERRCAASEPGCPGLGPRSFLCRQGPAGALPVSLGPGPALGPAARLRGGQNHGMEVMAALGRTEVDGLGQEAHSTV